MTITGASPAIDHAPSGRLDVADLQARFEHELALAYQRGYRDRASGRPAHDAALPGLDLGEAVERAALLVASHVQPQIEPPSWRDTVSVIDPSGTPWTFHRATTTVRPDFPTAIRIEATRPLSERDHQRLTNLAAYAYQTTVRGAPLGPAHRDSPYSLVVSADTSTSRRTHPMVALDDFEHRLVDWLHEGSPPRRTDKSGPRTAGTRAVDGLDDPALRVAVYYDRTRIEN